MAPKIVDKAAKRAEITRAATEVFARKGFQGASVDDVAAAAGFSKGTLYGYFQNKEELFYASFQAFRVEIMQLCEGAMAEQRTAWDKLRACLRFSADALRSQIELFPLTLEIWAAASSGPARDRFAEAMQGMYAEFRHLTAGLLRAGCEAGEFRADIEPEAVAAWLVGGLDGLMLQFWFDQNLDVENLIDGFLDVVHRGIAAG